MTRLIEPLLRRRQPAPADAQAFMDAVMSGQVEAVELASVLTAMRFTGVSATTLAAFARAIRSHMVQVPAAGPLVDTCGTGGSGLSTANTSTMAAFVAAACGARVAKHGNRASSGRCGSSDLLEALGVPLKVGPAQAAHLIDAVGVAFLFAPAYHPAFRHVGPVRRALGFRTVFNLLGPLCNPAGADRQLLGISDPTLAPLMAEALRQLGSANVLIVHGEDGLDELSLTAPSRIWSVRPDGIEESVVHPEDVGLTRTPAAAIRGGDVATNVAVFEQVFSGSDSAHSQLVRLNAGAALLVAGIADDLSAGVAMATDALESGAARERFERYRHAAGGRGVAA
ncbi:MAG: anthranilate phosphoribosyltransferase [Myxococcota bacterium]